VTALCALSIECVLCLLSCLFLFIFFRTLSVNKNTDRNTLIFLLLTITDKLFLKRTRPTELNTECTATRATDKHHRTVIVPWVRPPDGDKGESDAKGLYTVTTQYVQ